MSLASRSARCSGFERSARIPPWIFGCRVLTRPPSISGLLVTEATSWWAIPASVRAAEVCPEAISSTPAAESPRAKSISPVLS